MKKTKLKSEYANKLIEQGIKPYSIVNHSYTTNRLSGNRDLATVQSVDRDLSPALTTRCDCLGVVVPQYIYIYIWREETSKEIQELHYLEKQWGFL